MKPRRENGAGLVSPTISDVSKVSSLMGVLRLVGRRIQNENAGETQITSLRDPVWSRQKNKAAGGI
jgi:hypothetical protein